MSTWALQEELDSLNDPDGISIENEVDLQSSAQVTEALNNVVDTLAADSDAITQQDTLDTVKSLLKHADQLQPTHLNKLLDTLCSGFTSELDATLADAHPSDHTAYRSHQTALEVYAFAIQWFITIAERSSAAAETLATGKKPRGKAAAAKPKAASKSKTARTDWAWSDSIPAALNTLSNVLGKLKTDRIYQTTQERDTFLSCFIKSANRIAESEAYMKSPEIKLAYIKVLALACKYHSQSFSVQTAVSQNLGYTEHLADSMAELVSILVKDYDYSPLGEEVLREISGKTFQDKADAKISKSYSKFLIKLAELCPRLVLKQISLLQKHLDSESYQIRNAIVEVIGLLIKDLSTTTADLADGGHGANGVGEEAERQANNATQIAQFFDLLIARFLDNNSFVRSKAVQTLTKLMELPAKFPEKRLKITQRAIRSLSDKSSIVRKNSILLLKQLVVTHPYGVMHGGDLNATEWEKRYDQISAELKPLDDAMKQAAERASAVAEAPPEPPSPAKVEGTAEGQDAPLGSPSSAEESQPSDPAALAGLSPEELWSQLDSSQLSKLRLMKRYYADARTFIRYLEEGYTDKDANDHTGAIEKITELLNSTTKSEVLEAMDFLTICYQYKMEAAQSGVRALLHLVWAKDASTVETTEDGKTKEVKGIRPTLMDCYKRLYFEDDPELDEKGNINRVAKNLITMTFGATLAELTSLEELLTIMVQRDAAGVGKGEEQIVGDDVVEKLWQVYATSKDISKAQRRGAIMILGMIAVAKQEVISDHVDLLLKIGLGPLGRKDFVLAKYSCLALRRLAGSQKKVKGSLKDTSTRLQMESPIFPALAALLQLKTEDKEWFGMAEEAINTIYVLGDQPDKLCSDLLRSLTKTVFNPATPTPETEESHPETQAPNTEVADPPAETPAETPAIGDLTMASQNMSVNQGPSVMADSFQLAQLIFIAGHVAIKHLIHLELIEKELKRRKEVSGTAANTASSSASKKDELDQVAGSVEDDIADTIQETKERELLYGPESLLAIFGPMTVQICAYPKQYRNRTLRVAAVLTLSKFMCVSAKFCEDHLMMLFRIFETSPDPVIKANIAIALGDIAVAFSTIMDDNSDRLYAGLANSNLNVKKNTLMVLTHLILNGMIKVKGQLGEMAKCLEDEDRRIKDLAKLFFSELATKDNAIYNNLPDIVSSLSSGSHKVTEEIFESTMQYIFKFIDKEKQAESIIEKLCLRFKFAGENLEGSTDEERRECEERRWRDIALCLSMLPYKSDRSIKKLMDALPLYQDKLYEETVFKRFGEILKKAKSAKEDSPDYGDFEAILQEHRAKVSEDVELERKVEKKKKREAAKRKAPAAPGIRKAPPQPRQEASESEPEDAEEEAPAPKKAPRKAAPRRKQAAASGSENEAPVAPRRGGRKKAVRPVAASESDQEDI